jgi:hypothetical protein
LEYYHVGRFATEEPIVTRTTDNTIITLVALKQIITALTKENIVARTAINLVDASTTIDGVVTITAIDSVVTIAAINEIVATAAIDKIVTPSGDDDIIPRGAYYSIITFSANTGRDKGSIHRTTVRCTFPVFDNVKKPIFPIIAASNKALISMTSSQCECRLGIGAIIEYFHPGTPIGEQPATSPFVHDDIGLA